MFESKHALKACRFAIARETKPLQCCGAVLGVEVIRPGLPDLQEALYGF